MAVDSAGDPMANTFRSILLVALLLACGCQVTSSSRSLDKEQANAVGERSTRLSRGEFKAAAERICVTTRQALISLAHSPRRGSPLPDMLARIDQNIHALRAVPAPLAVESTYERLH